MIHFDPVGNGLFEDDVTDKQWSIPCCVYRFRRGKVAAYVWNEAGEWLLRSWHPMSEQSSPPELLIVSSFEAALDRLMIGST